MRHITLGSHLVAFLDVLGQRERFKALKHPTTPKEQAAVNEVLKQTAGFVMDLREIFKNQFLQFDAGLVHMKAHAGSTVVPKFIGFSDSFIAHVPLRTDNGDLQMLTSIFSTLSSAAIVMLTSLASQHPLRGGIDVGLGTALGENEIYGTALERAYVLECKEADYPRIVVGDELWTFLNTAKARFQSPHDPCRTIVDTILTLITEDTDRKRILHYLSPFLLARGGAKFLQLMVNPALAFVLAEEKRVIELGNAKLIHRYEALRSYFERSLLNLAHVQSEATLT